MDEDYSGLSIQGYRLIQQIGEGSFGVVWKAEETLTGRLRAVKILPKTKATDRELEGIRRCLHIRDDSVIEIVHVGEAADSYYYVMQLADDWSDRHAAARQEVSPVASSAPPEPYVPYTLRRLIEQESPITPSRALVIIEQVFKGLAVLHSHDLIHRDVKPENILFVGGKVKLGDLGLIASTTGNLTLVGTPRYMAPERRVTKKSDLFSAGQVLREMVEGYDIEEGSPKRKFQDPAEGHAYRVSVRIADAAGHGDVARRIGSAKAVLRYLSRLKDLSSFKRRRRRIITAVTATVLAVSTAVISLFTNHTAPSSQPTGHDSASVVRRVANQQGDGAADHGFEIILNSGEKRWIKRKSPVRSATMGEFWFGRPCIAIGFNAEGPDAGCVHVYDAEECARNEDPSPIFKSRPFNAPPSAWEFQEHSSFCNTAILGTGDLDGRPGEELVVSALHDDGPAEIIVYGEAGLEIGSYWHYGWIDAGAVVDCDGDKRNDLLCQGIANLRESRLPWGRRDEALYGCMMVLNWEGLRQQVGYWGAVPWLQYGSTVAPLAYGRLFYQMGAKTGPPDIHSPTDWSWSRSLIPLTSNGDRFFIRQGIKPDLLIELNPDLSPIRVAYESQSGHEGDTPPDINSIWQRTLPLQPTNVKDPPRSGE